MSFFTFFFPILISTENKSNEFHGHLDAEAQHAGPEFPGNPGADVDQSRGHQEDHQVERVTHVTQSTNNTELSYKTIVSV